MRVGGQRRAQLVAGADLELVVNVAQVVLDRLRAEVQAPGRLARGRALGESQRDLKLLRSQLTAITFVAHSRRLARSLQLSQGPLGPRRRAQFVEAFQGCSE